MLTTTELLSLLDRPYAWFETKRRRNRQAAESRRVEGGRFEKVDPDKVDLPVKDIFGGAWAKYDFEDALNMAVTLELEERGLSFLAASRLTTNAGATEVLSHGPNDPDFYIGKVVDLEGATRHFSGGRESVVLADDEVTLIAINVTMVLRRLRKKSLEVGLAEKLGW